MMAAEGEASRGLDDDYFGPPAEPKPEEVAGTKRYNGGYATDLGLIASGNNFAHEGPVGYRGEVLPRFLPADLAALQARLGPIDLDPSVGDAAPLAMLASEGLCHVDSGAREAWLDRPSRGGDLVPSGERPRPEFAKGGAGDQVALDVEVVVDGGMGGKEPLCRAR